MWLWPQALCDLHERVRWKKALSVLHTERSADSKDRFDGPRSNPRRSAVKKRYCASDENNAGRDDRDPAKDAEPRISVVSRPLDICKSNLIEQSVGGPEGLLRHLPRR